MNDGKNIAMKENNLTTQLAYLGTIPFIFGALCIALGYKQLLFINDIVQMVNSYGLVIVVFMAGIHWGNYLSDDRCRSINLLLLSNIVTLLSWFAFLLMPTKFAVLVYCLAFSFLLFVDSKLLSNDVISSSYFKLRLIITSIVILCLLLVSYNLFK